MEDNTKATAGEMTGKRQAETATDSCSVLAYRLEKKKRQVRKLKKKMRFDRAWRKADSVFWFLAGAVTMGMIYSICHAAVDMAQRGELIGF